VGFWVIKKKEEKETNNRRSLFCQTHPPLSSHPNSKVTPKSNPDPVVYKLHIHQQHSGATAENSSVVVASKSPF